MSKQEKLQAASDLVKQMLDLKLPEGATIKSLNVKTTGCSQEEAEEITEIAHQILERVAYRMLAAHPEI